MKPGIDGLNMNQGKKYTHETLNFLKGLFILLALSSGITAAIGLFIYSLYRVAIYSRQVYTIVFTSALGCIIFYFFWRVTKKRKVVRVLLSFFRIMSSIMIVLLICGLFLGYGAFTVRYPRIGIPISPFFAIGVVMFILRLKPLYFIKKFFYNRLEY